MSINKSQGQSVKHVGLDLRNAVFTHGQLYVAISRVTSVWNIKAIWDSGIQAPVMLRLRNIIGGRSYSVRCRRYDGRVWRSEVDGVKTEG